MDGCSPWSGEPAPVQALVADVYVAFAAELRRFVTARTRDADSAEDIVQEAFVRLAVLSRASRDPKNPQAWLCRVARNLVISRSRRATVARRRDPQLAMEKTSPQSPEMLFLSSERSRALGLALEAVGVSARTSLVLAAHGYTCREIAERLGRSEGATRSIMCRARQVVRRELTNQELAMF